MKREANVGEIADLECRIEERQEQQHDLQVQMREQCGDYEELLGQKMARDIEIVAYRGLVEEEDVLPVRGTDPDQAKQPAFGDGYPPYRFDVTPKHNRPKSSIRDPMKLTATQPFEQM
eukprot:XP_014054501.1 PREDICTED: neurofilament light polypeptide-like [Salmo salar]